MGGITFHMNRRPGPVSSPKPSDLDFRARLYTAMASDPAAASNQTVSHMMSDDAVTAKPDATRATIPIATPPMPDTWVNDPDRSIVSRM